MHSEFKSISEIIKKEKAFDALRETAKEADVVERFNELFPDLSKVAKAVKVKQKTLFLRVENSVWRSELNYKQQLMIKKINDLIGENVVTSIRFIS